MPSNWIDPVLYWTSVLIVVSAAVWFASWLFQYFRRRALNLTTTETVSQRDVQPDFLKVDQQKRDAALQGGAAFDQHIADRDRPEMPANDTVESCKGFARIITIVLALVSLVTGIIGALVRVEVYDDVVKKYGVWDNAVAIVSAHPVGFAIALGVIGLVAFNFVRTLRSGT